MQTFSYEIEIDPYKKSLNSFLTEKKNCTLNRIIGSFKKNIVGFYCYRSLNKLILKTEIRKEISKYIKELDEIILDFISIIIKIVPKFFLDLPKNIQDVEGIVRNSIISDELLSLLILIRKETSNELQDQYIKSL